MKKWKQLLMLAVIALTLTFVSKVESKAASQITGLKQVDASSGSVEFTWNADLSVDKYLVEMSQDGKTWVAMDTTYSASSYVYKLTAGSTYYARVTGYKDDVVVATTSDTLEVVTAPYSSNLKAVQSAAGTTSATVQYSNYSGANLFYITYNDAVIAQSTSASVTTKVKLSPATQYWVRCYVARKSASGFIATGSYDYIDIKTVSNKINTKNFGISNNYANINVYDFAVSSQGSVDGYQFQFLTMKGKVKKTVTTTSNSIDVRNFIGGNFYKYRVRSFVACGSGNAYSAWSGYKYIGMSKQYKGNANRKRIKCSWSKVNSASGYVVYISTKRNSGYKKVKTLSAKTRGLSITKYGKKKIKKGKTYYVKVVARAKSGKKTVASSVWWIGKASVPRD